MAANKGYDLLIRAMPPVFERVADARLLLGVGSTEPTPREREQVKELKALARELGIADRVIFRDFIEDDVLADHYRIADVFALSSRYEPFGMTAVEAMACGTPTVITTEGGLWEQVVWGLEALYANPFDPEAFGYAICTILQNRRVADQLAKYGSQRRGRSSPGRALRKASSAWCRLFRPRDRWAGSSNTALRKINGARKRGR
jgi:mannosylfructose-phosphate synthase